MWPQVIRCFNCGHNNPLDSFFCEMCGSPLRRQQPPQSIPPPQVPIPSQSISPQQEPAHLPPPEVKEVRFSLVGKTGRIDVVGQQRVFGRADFINMLSPEDARYVSRQHFQIKYDNGKYYIQDLGSKNGTKLNGIDIRGKGWVELNNGDTIGIADVLEMRFQA